MHDDFMDDHGANSIVLRLTLDDADVELNQIFIPIMLCSTSTQILLQLSDIEVNDSFQAESAKPNFVSNTVYSDQFMNDFFHANNK